MHKQAAFNTLKFVASAIITGVAIALSIEYLTLATVMMALGCGVIVYFVYMFYQIEKSRLETIETLKK